MRAGKWNFTPLPVVKLLASPSEFDPCRAPHDHDNFRNIRKEEVVLAQLRLGYTRVTHLYLLLGEEQPQCVGCDAPFTVHLPFGVWRFCTSKK